MKRHGTRAQDPRGDVRRAAAGMPPCLVETPYTREHQTRQGRAGERHGSRQGWRGEREGPGGRGRVGDTKKSRGRSFASSPRFCEARCPVSRASSHQQLPGCWVSTSRPSRALVHGYLRVAIIQRLPFVRISTRPCRNRVSLTAGRGSSSGRDPTTSSHRFPHGDRSNIISSAPYPSRRGPPRRLLHLTPHNIPGFLCVSPTPSARSNSSPDTINYLLNPTAPNPRKSAKNAPGIHGRM